jgi:hypothetical protein
MLIFRYSNGFSSRHIPRSESRLALCVRQGAGFSRPAPPAFFRYGISL